MESLSSLTKGEQARMVVIVPSRGRPDKIDELIQAFDDTGATADLVVVLDHDDEHNYPRRERAKYIVVQRRRPGMNDGLNTVARMLSADYEFVGFMGDDHRPRTDYWDLTVLKTLVKTNPSVVYGNDLLQGEALATAVFMDMRFVRVLNFMAPPDQLHLYLDNFWMLLGKASRLVYLPEVIIEHMHYTVGKSEQDEGYTQVNSGMIYMHDQLAFESYLDNQWPQDLERLIERGLAHHEA